MIGGLAAARRVAAVALLALGSTAPLNAPVRTATIAPVADTSTACAVTVGTATTDPTLAADAARAIAVGYTPTDCLPDVQLLAAAEARAAIPMGSTTTPTTSSPLGGSRSLGRVAAAPTTTSTPTTTTPPTTDTPSPTETSTTETSSTENESNDGSSSGTESNGSNTGLSNEPTNNGNAGCVDTGTAAAANVAVANGTPTDATTDGTGTTTGDAATNDTAADGATTSTATSAACTLSWGTATGVEDFDDAGLTNWSRYDGPGHAGKGIRGPDAMSVNGGVLTITGDSNGTTGGMAWQVGRSKYGRWEARVKSPVADPSYNAVMLLWPDDIEWPTGGEVDFMEIGDETRQEVDFFLHYSSENRQLHGSKQIDATQWHNWAVEWSPTKITGYVDGIEWFSTTQTSALPPGSMHLTLQLDWFPKGGSVQQSAMHVDWVRYYPIDGSGAPGEIVESLGTTSDTGVTLSRSGSTDTGGGSGTTEDEGTDEGTDDAAENDDSVAGATSTTTVTVEPESEPTTTTPESDPATGDDSAGEGEDGTDGADGTGAETGTADQNGDDAGTA